MWEKPGPMMMKMMEDMPLKEMAMMTAPASVSDIMKKMGYKHTFVIGNTTPRTPEKILFWEAITVRSMPTRPDILEMIKKRAWEAD